jgi:hypothetical protein
VPPPGGIRSMSPGVNVAKSRVSSLTNRLPSGANARPVMRLRPDA